MSDAYSLPALNRAVSQDHAKGQRTYTEAEMVDFREWMQSHEDRLAEETAAHEARYYGPAEEARIRTAAGVAFAYLAGLMALLYVGYLLALHAPVWLTLALATICYAVGFVGLLALTVVAVMAVAAWAAKAMGVRR